MTASCARQEEAASATKWKLFVFWLTNGFIALFFDAFWLLGYRVAALDRLSQTMGYFQFVLWFACFFFASVLTLRSIVRERLAIRCLGIALGLFVFTYALLTISAMILAPYLDPWF